MPKKGGLGNLQGVLGKKYWGGVFDGGVDTPMHIMELDALLHKTCIKVLKLDMCTSMVLLSKIVHQMWCDHPLSKRNKTTE